MGNNHRAASDTPSILAAGAISAVRRNGSRLLGYLRQARSIVAPRRSVQARGLRFTLPCDNLITRYRWQTYNSKEPETLDWIDRTIRDGETLVDIGANIGLYTIYAALRHPKARVVACEPEYANLHLLRDNILKNGLAERVQVYSLALGDHTGLSRLHIQDLTPGAAMHTESTDALSLTRTQHSVVWREGICTFTLDAFCEQAGLQPNHLKIDVDGTEEEVLRGAQRTLRSAALRSLLAELPNDPREYQACERLLLDAGLRCEWRGSGHQDSNDIWVRE